MKTIIIPIMRAAALGLALAWLAPLGQAEKLPVETFFKDPEFSRMRLSPDGKWLAAIAPREGKNNLLTIRLSDRKLFGCTAEDENEVYSFNWISNERIIFQMKDRNNFPNGGLYAVDRDGSRHKVLNPSFKTYREFGSRVFKAVELFDPLTDEGGDILVSVRKGGGRFREDRSFYGNIVRLNTLTAKEKRVVFNRGDILQFVADREKIIRIGVAQHGLNGRSFTAEPPSRTGRRFIPVTSVPPSPHWASARIRTSSTSPPPTATRRRCSSSTSRRKNWAG